MSSVIVDLNFVYVLSVEIIVEALANLTNVG